jgi:hypothetical protein
MPGTSTTGVHRLLMWAIALVAGTIAVGVLADASMASTLPQAAPAAGTRTITVAAHRTPTRHTATAAATVAQHVLTANTGSSGNGAPAGTQPQLGVAPDAGVAVAPAVTPGVGDGAAGGAVSGQAAGTTDLSADSVSAPPAVPWIVVALFVLVVAGAVRAYGRSPQRAAIRDHRTPH